MQRCCLLIIPKQYSLVYKRIHNRSKYTTIYYIITGIQGSWNHKRNERESINSGIHQHRVSNDLSRWMSILNQTGTHVVMRIGTLAAMGD